MSQTWSPTDDQPHAAFVPALGATILVRLAPQAGERILDLGCGDGVLTADLVSSGAEVVALDDVIGDVVGEEGAVGAGVEGGEAHGVGFPLNSH